MGYYFIATFTDAFDPKALQDASFEPELVLRGDFRGALILEGEGVVKALDAAQAAGLDLGRKHVGFEMGKRAGKFFHKRFGGEVMSLPRVAEFLLKYDEFKRMS